MTQLQLTLDAATTPSRILPGLAQNQLVELAGPCTIGVRGTASISRPLATDQLAITCGYPDSTDNNAMRHERPRLTRWTDNPHIRPD